MNILIITSNIGRTAPGIVFERLIYGLSKLHEVEVLTEENDSTIDLSTVSIIRIPKKRVRSSRLQKLLFSFLGVNLGDLQWVGKVIDVNKRNPKKYDIIFSMISYGHYAPIMAGDKLASLLGIKLYVYSVDAIPAPIAWLKNDLLYRKIQKLISKYMTNVDGLFSANEKMLRYQLNVIKPKKKIISDVIYNPSYGGIKTYESISEDLNIFLYTGGIYGRRNPKYILQAFKVLLITHSNSRLEFVGTVLSEEVFSIFTKEERNKIVIHGFTKDLEPFYARATALIDIDADLPDDIYLSSKMTNYILINRPIICETGIESPSMKLFKNIPSIFQCGHDADELLAAMTRSINLKGQINFDDRDEVISLFNLDNIVRRIDHTLAK